MPVLDRDALAASPLADLHAIASELSLDGYRRLRKAALIDALIAHQGGQDGAAAAATADAETESSENGGARRRRGRRGGRGRGAGHEEAAAAESPAGQSEAEPAPSSRSRSRGRSKPEQKNAHETEPSGERHSQPRDERESEPRGERHAEHGGEAEPAAGAELVEGVVELLSNGSGFVRLSLGTQSDADVYVSAAQIKRCELVTGDRVSGPRRAPHRSERYPSLVRIDTVNGRPASEIADRARFDELPCEPPNARFKLDAEDATLKAIEFLTPFGRGSRVTIVGDRWAGKSHALRLLADALAAQEGVSVLVSLAGVRPEEIAGWSSNGAAPAAAVSFAASTEAQEHAIELVVDQAKRLASRGENVVVLIDTLDHVQPALARRALAAARNLTGGGSLTVVATASAPLGGETTVIALNAVQTSINKFPALDLTRSGTLRPELLVGKTAANAIVKERAKALK